MRNRRPGNGPKKRRTRAAILERMVGKLLSYVQEFLLRHGLPDVTISAKLRDGAVSRVTHSSSTVFSTPESSSNDQQRTASAHDGGGRGTRCESLLPDELHAMIGRHLNRLLRRFAVRFGAVDIEVKKGKIKTIRVTLLFRPAELWELVRLLGATVVAGLPDHSRAAGGAARKANSDKTASPRRIMKQRCSPMS